MAKNLTITHPPTQNACDTMYEKKDINIANSQRKQVSRHGYQDKHIISFILIQE